MTKPWIGIPTRYHEKTGYIGQIRHYLDAVLWAGGLPLLIPTVSGAEDAVSHYLPRIDGILLPGSPTDIDPAHYGETAHPRLGKACPERDALDFRLLEYSENRGLPVLGICFGIQSLNVFRGGKLIQDIPSLVAGASAHDDKGGDTSKPAHHEVRLEAGSVLAGLAGREVVEVNSFHHQAVQKPGKNLKVVGLSQDGVIEAVEDSTGRFIIGVQWHPERGWADSDFAKALFRSLVQHAEILKSKTGSV